jgi:dihydroxyacetone kinase-like predicted kinase
LLPLLKQAGVVDSGGAGLFYILEGMLRSAYGEKLEDQAPDAHLPRPTADGLVRQLDAGQDWEIVVDITLGEGHTMADLQSLLDPIGTSLQIGDGDGMCRVHVHLAEGRQYEAIESIRGLGVVLRVSLENLRAQIGAAGASSAPGRTPEPTAVRPEQIGAVAVASGGGFVRVVAGLGAAVVEGGPLMNPSVAALLEAIDRSPAERVIVLPNDPNVVHATRQAAQLSRKQVAVVPAKSVPQGIGALLAFDPDGELDEVAAAMTEALAQVRTGELAAATRSARVDGVDVVEGQVIGMIDGVLRSAADGMESALLGLLDAASREPAELLTIYYGAGILRGEAEGLAERTRRVWPKLEVDVVEGGQPHRPIVFSLE